MSGRRAAAVALGIAALAGCPEAPVNLGPFAVRYTLESSTCQEATSCATFGMSCGATLLFRIVDLEARDPADAEVVERCVEVDPATNLCGLGAAGLGTLFNIPPHRIRVEVAAWRPDALQGTGGCPDSSEVFTDAGLPILGTSPAPAFAGTAEFDAGSAATEAEVPLRCLAPAELAAECDLSGRTLVTALVDDLEAGRRITNEQASTVTVGVAEPREGGGPDGSFHELVSSDVVDLRLEPLGSSPTFQALTDAVLGSQVCTRVDEDVARSTATLSCENVIAGDNPLLTHGVLVGKPVVDDVLDALGSSDFPPAGLLIGRVLDTAGAAVAGVTVRPARGTVRYLSSDRASLIGTQTSASGYFVATDVPFDTAFQATHPDGRVEQGSPRGGLLRGQLSVVMVRLGPP